MAMMLATPDGVSPIPSLNLGPSAPPPPHPHEKSPLKEEEELWNRLNKRARCLSDSSPNDENKKKKKKEEQQQEDMKLLDKGLQAVASSLTQLAHSLGTATVEEGINLGESPISLSEVIPIAVASNLVCERPATHYNPSPNPNPKKTFPVVEDAEQVHSKEKLRQHRTVAEAMAGKAKFLERQMKSLKADLCFMRERCAFLEEENARLRDRDGDGVRPEEDDLVRLQLEALLAEKGRLAQENANYARENEYLHQLVEYHQLTLQEDMAAMPPAMCSDFPCFSLSPSPSPCSSPLLSPHENENGK